VLCSVSECDERKHDRHFHQHAYDRCQRCARPQTEQAYRDRYGQLEKVGRADEGAGGSDVERDAPSPRCPVGQKEDAVGLDQQRHRNQGNYHWALKDHFPLKGEKQHDSDQQADDRKRLNARLEGCDNRFATLGHQALSRQVSDQQRQYDIEADRQQ
jgi:hypothetical protein